MLHPIGFSIPSQKIVLKIPEKKKILAYLIPQKRFEKRETYIYDDEEEYYQDYRDSLFALTKKKAGWDCLRHYEIMAQGCIPLFENLEECPKNTLTFLPKDKLIEAKKYYDLLKQNEIVTKKCLKIAEELLSYTKLNLTNQKMAEYILEVSGHQDARKILFISGLKRYGMIPNYMRDLLLLGFKKLFGKGCHDYPRVPHIYEDYGNEQKLYGKGFTYAKNVPSSERDCVKDFSLEKDIESHYYDIIIYGSYHDGMPLLDKILSIYAKNEIILVCGDDIHVCDHQKFVNKGHHVFVRELN